MRTILPLALVLALTACSASVTTVEDLTTVSDPAASSADSSAAGGLTSLDDTWNLYRNTTVGYSLKVPKQISIVSDLPPVPATVLEDEAAKTAFVTAAMTLASPAGNDLAPVTVDLLRDPDAETYPPAWILETRDAEHSDALAAFVRTEIGPGCVIESTQPLGYDTQQVILAADDGTDDTRTCEGLTENPVIFYSPGKKAVVFWKLGHDVRFVGDAEGTTVYDLEMVDSFRFE